MKWLRIGDHSYERLKFPCFLNFFTLDEDRKIEDADFIEN